MTQKLSLRSSMATHDSQNASTSIDELTYKTLFLDIFPPPNASTRPSLHEFKAKHLGAHLATVRAETESREREDLEDDAGGSEVGIRGVIRGSAGWGCGRDEAEERGGDVAEQTRHVL